MLCKAKSAKYFFVWRFQTTSKLKCLNDNSIGKNVYLVNLNDNCLEVNGSGDYSLKPCDLEKKQQYFEKDRAWKDKYVKNISTFDWKFEFMEDAHRGTGNLYADQLLAPYITNGMVVF